MPGIEERYKQVLDYFSRQMPDAATELRYASSYELLVAVILSAQCTDKRVNTLTPAFFRRFPDPESLASAKFDEVFSLIKSCSYPNNKSKHLIAMALSLMEDFGGVVPDNLEDLQKLPGVGRKTANVILAVVFGQPAMPVDTHVFRVAARLGLTTNAKNPLQAEQQLVKHIPPELIPHAHHWLILHGRYICLARKPKCGKCGLAGLCLYEEKNLSST